MMLNLKAMWLKMRNYEKVSKYLFLEKEDSSYIECKDRKIGRLIFIKVL